MSALQRDGGVDLLVTGRGAFRAQLTRMVLLNIHLLAGDENLARIALVNVHASRARVWLPVRGDTPAYIDGVRFEPGVLMTHRGGQCLHERTGGPSQWRVISLSLDDLLRYGRIVAGASFAVPPGTWRWQPKPQTLRILTSLYDSAIRMNKQRPMVTVIAEAARGLENEVIHALVECMQDDMPPVAAAIPNPCAGILARFDELIRADPCARASTRHLCAALGVAEPVLEACCDAFFGVGSYRYRHLRQLRLVRRALRDAGSGVPGVPEVARRFGFDKPETFDAAYLEQYEETPLTTLQRGAAH